MQAAPGSPKTMKRLILAALLHVATTNNCERATDLKPEHFCAKPTNADALRSAIPDAADALPLHGGTPPSLEIAQGRVAKQKARLMRKAAQFMRHREVARGLRAWLSMVDERETMRRGFHDKMIVRQHLARIDSPAARHPEMEDHRVAAIGIDQPVFGASPEPGHHGTGESLAEIGGERPAQVGPARLDERDPLVLQYRAKPVDGGFDFGKLRHPRCR